MESQEMLHVPPTEQRQAQNVVYFVRYDISKRHVRNVQGIHFRLRPRHTTDFSKCGSIRILIATI